jgi:hypothetical protein
MKKIILCALTGLFLLTSSVTQVQAGVNTNATSIPVESAEAEVLLNRLKEIDAMDKTALKGSEKRKLRKEVRTINKELKEMNGGVYLSVGAVIIIILLLILLL